MRYPGSVSTLSCSNIWFWFTQPRQAISLYMAAIGGVKVSFGHVRGKLGSNVAQRPVASHDEGAVHAKLLAYSPAHTKLTSGIPY